MAPVSNHWNTERALFTVALRDIHTSHRQRVPRLRWAVHPHRRLRPVRGGQGALSVDPGRARPALRSVTCRTLSSVLDRLRSINFCRLRTCFRSPACDTVKIRCCGPRTSSSTARQLVGSRITGRISCRPKPNAHPGYGITECLRYDGVWVSGNQENLMEGLTGMKSQGWKRGTRKRMSNERVLANIFEGACKKVDQS